MAHAIPGPRGAPIVGALPQILAAGRFEYLQACWRRYGDLYRVPLVRWPGRGDRRDDALLVTSHPDAAERILRVRHDNFYKGPNYDPVRELMGHGLVTASGDLWVRQRKLMQPAFRRGAIHDFLPTMHRCTADMLATWERRYAGGRPFDVAPEMMDLARRIIGLTMFGMDLGASSSASAQAVTDSVECLGERMEGLVALPLSLPTPGNLRFRRAMRVLDAIVFDIIDRARRGLQDGGAPNILQAMLAARDEGTGAAMSDQQLRDEVITLYLAGHETTALSLTWTLYFLTRDREAMARVVAEVDGLADEVPPLAALDGLTYARMVLDEVLRLRPPAWGLAREAREDDELLGAPIPAGSLVLFNIFNIHHHPDVWGDDPGAFDPERFTPARVEARSRFAHMPFSGGPRVCIGKAFSIYETLLALVGVLRRFRVEYAGEGEVGLQAFATLRPAGPVRLRLRPRRGQAD